MISLLIYTLCVLTSATCSWLLLRGYRRTGARLLLWSGLCFCGLALNNLLLIVDVHVLPDVNLAIVRTLPAVIGISLLLFGLIWDTTR
ncbi:DUF5985 family protein [Gemmatimonas sp.]|uniref:DUF5985 family protein n=1 Tax=Gemmatimonas sp. TaxID=1962908 RepID=UPI003983B7FB